MCSEDVVRGSFAVGSSALDICCILGCIVMRAGVARDLVKFAPLNTLRSG
jgi:hypothetical protein